MIQLLLHLFGDYILQSDWMALRKHRDSIRCFIHVVLYTLPFLFITQSITALSFIFVTHFIIDRFSLPKYLIWVKNHLNPTFTYYPWSFCSTTGYFDNPRHTSNEECRPFHITVMLYIVTDNGLHLACNAFALYYL